MDLGEALRRHHVCLAGVGTQPMVFAHGFGCDQTMWRLVAPAFEATHRVVLFDHLGSGRSDARAYDPQRHATLAGYAADVVDLLEALDLRDVVFVGHSVSAMIGALASIAAPDRFASLVMIGPSPRYLNDPPHYHGGFEPADIEALAGMMETDLGGFADHLWRIVAGGQGDLAAVREQRAAFCTADPAILRQFAQATFLADNREDLPKVSVPALVVQVEHDAIAPPVVGRYCHDHLADSRLALLPTCGHSPQLTDPEATIRAIREFLAG